MTRPARAWALPLCWAAVLLDGFDLVVLGTVLPVLLREHVWGLTPASASMVTTVGLLGMMVGALTIGAITDLVGRRKVLIVAVASFSLFTALCAVAPSVEIFAALRFLAGLGLGGCLPTAITLVAENASKNARTSAATTIMTGYHVGAVVTALLGIAVIPGLGWRALFVIGAAPALVLVPLMVRYLPESTSFLEGRKGERRSAVRTLFEGGMWRATLAFWAASFMGLLLVYGLNTWLPEIMRQAGYPLGAALSLLLVLNAGAALGLLVAGKVADRIGVRPATIMWFVSAAVFLALLSVKLPGPALYVVVFMAGWFVFSSQTLTYAYVAHRYPAASRATAMGGAAGVGRIGAICGPLLGGALLSAGMAYPWGFYAFAVAGACGALAILAVGRSGVSVAEEKVPA